MNMIDLEYNAAYRYIERLDEISVDLWMQFKRRPRAAQKWNYIDADYLAESWLAYIYGGKVAKERVDKMIDQALTNAVQLRFNTIMAGHTEQCPVEYLYSLDIRATQKQIDRFCDTIIDPVTGQLWISDFGLHPMEEILFKLQEQSVRGKLLMIYRILNVVHRRSDFSAYFVRGGLFGVAVVPDLVM